MTAAEAGVVTSRATSGSAWALTLLFLASVLNLLDRQIVNILAQSIKVDLHITDAELGMLTGTAFGVLYAMLGVPLGRVADRVNRAKLIALALVVWSGFTCACGFAWSFPQLFGARMGVGIGEAAIQPASTALVRDFVPPSRRASAMSLLLLGAPVGAFLGLLLGGWFGANLGWRMAFVAAGAPGILLGLVVFAALRDPCAGVREPPPPLFKTVAGLVGDPRLRRVTLGLICATLMVYATGAWLPAFFMRTHGLRIDEVGRYSALAVGVGGGLGALGSGVLCDLLRRRVPDVELKVLMVALVCTVPALMAVLFSRAFDEAVLAMGVFNLFAYAYLGPIVVLIQKQADDRTRAVAIGICIAVSNVTTLGFGLPLVGAVSDVLAGVYGARSLAYALAWTLGPAALLGVVAFWRAGAIAPREP